MSGTNPVANWNLTNFTTQDPATYKTNIDGNFDVLQRIGTKFAPYAQSTPNMTINLAAGSIFSGTTLTEVGVQTTPTITAPVSNSRIDRVVISSTTGSLSVITGTSSTSPTPPTISAGNLPVAQILVTSTSTAINNSMITDERNLSSAGYVSSGVAGNVLVDNGSSTLPSFKMFNFRHGLDIASSSTVNLDTATGQIIDITGTATITAITLADGSQRVVRFTNSLTLTNSSSLVLPGGVNINTVAGDFAVFQGYSSGVVRCIGYTASSTGYIGTLLAGTSANNLLQLNGSGRLPNIPMYDGGTIASQSYVSSIGFISSSAYISGAGYMFLSNGFKIQWGVTPNMVGLVNVTFPTSFPSGTLNIMTNGLYSASASFGSAYGVYITNRSSSGFQVTCRDQAGSSNYGLPMYYIAIGV